MVSNIFHFHPEPWGNDPIWRLHIFQMGWQVQPPTSHHSTCFEFPGFTKPNGIDQGHSGGANAAGDWGCQVSLPETDSKFAPEKWMVGWRRVCFLLGWPIFQVLLLLVSGRGSCPGNFFGFGKSWHSFITYPVDLLRWWWFMDSIPWDEHHHFFTTIEGRTFSKHWRSKSKILPQIVSISMLSLSFDDIPKVRRPHLEIVQFDCHTNERFLAKRIQRFFFLMVM